MLITSSFWLYARQTEDLAYDQLTTTCRLLRHPDRGPPAGDRLPADSPAKASDAEESKDRRSKTSTSSAATGACRASLGDYHIWKVTRNTRPEQMPSDNYTVQRLKEFLDDSNKLEDNHLLLSNGPHLYYAAVRASESCLECHREIQHRANPDLPEMQEKDLIALIKIEVPTKRSRPSRTASTSTGPC